MRDHVIKSEGVHRGAHPLFIFEQMLVRNTFGFDFDEKINLSINGKVGDKVNLNMNYNTEATFDFDSKKMKLKYDGKEDEIIKLLEA